MRSKRISVHKYNDLLEEVRGIQEQIGDLGEALEDYTNDFQERLDDVLKSCEGVLDSYTLEDDSDDDN